MYGYIGAYAGFSKQELVDGATETKDAWLMSVDPYDKRAYELGWDLNQRRLKSDKADLCKELVALVGTGEALREGNKEGGYNDLSKCKPCPEKTRERRHGRNEAPRMRP